MGRRTFNAGGLRRVLVHLVPYLRPHRRTLAIAGLCMLGATAMELLKPWPLKFVFDVILAPDSELATTVLSLPWIGGELTLLLGAITVSMLLIAVLAGLFGFGQAYLAATVGQKVVAAIRHRVYAHIQRLSHSFHEDSSTGDLLARLTGDIRMMRELLVNAVIYVSDRSLVLLGMVAIMLWMDWLLTLVAVSIIPVLWWTVRHFVRDIKGATRRQRRKESEITHTMTEKLSSISLVQAFAREAYEEERFTRQNNKSMRAGVVSTRLEAHMYRLVQVILALGTAAVLWVGVMRVQSGHLTPGDLLVFTAYLSGLYKPIRKLSSLTSRVAKATVCGERVVSILETEPEIRDAPDAVEAPAFRGEIEFRHVSFAYPGSDAVLRDASLHICPGETVALVGASGLGKSTLARLLLRFYDPDSGSILVDGRDIRDYTLESLRRQFAVVLQEAVLFNTTVRDNIAYGKLDAGEDEIVAAARAASAHEFIERLPEGYETRISERGSSLSGGQRQRIAIARALIRRAPLVILDEPLTGLDAASRAEVEAALEALTKHSTCLVITHDRQSAARADRILRIDDGRLTTLPVTPAQPRKDPAVDSCAAPLLGGVTA